MTTPDIYGIGAALQMAAEIHRHASRRTGRTERLIACVKAGDTIVVPSQVVQRSVEHKLRAFRGAKHGVIVRIAAARDPYRLCELRGTAGCRTWFDHTWVEEFLKHSIEGAVAHLENVDAAINLDADTVPVAPTWSQS